MNFRYFMIEQNITDLDDFCSIIIGSERLRATIDVYPDLDMFYQVAEALSSKNVASERPMFAGGFDDLMFGLVLLVLPHDDGRKTFRAEIASSGGERPVSYKVEIEFLLSRDEALGLSEQLKDWLKQRTYTFIWKDY